MHNSFAGIFHGLGAEVTLVHRGENFLRGFDGDIRDTLRTAYIRRGIDLQFNLQVEGLEKSGEEVMATLSNGTGIVTDEVMFAIGRTPLTGGLGLDTVEVKLDGAGAVIVDDFSQTSAANIHAIGKQIHAAIIEIHAHSMPPA